MHCLLRAISSVWLQFVLCCGPLFCAHCVHECLNEDEMIMVWTLVLESEAVPPRTRLGIVCYEISVTGFGQPLQQRLIADPLPHEQPRALQRRSPSGYAWQVKVAAGKLVMAASKLTFKELGAGAQ